jgi:hypothetical protein
MDGGAMRTITRAIGPAVARTFRHAALPLAWYYAVTLALPIANGAARGGMAFVEHGAVVLALPIVIVLACATIRSAILTACLASALLQGMPATLGGQSGPLTHASPP